MNNFDFLTLSEVLGKDKLQIFEKCGTRCMVTDFSILLGCNYMSIPGNETDKAGWWWTKTRFNELEVMGITINGTEGIVYQDESRICIRPAINYSKIEMYAKNKKTNQHGVLEVEYGEYPQTIVSEETSKNLNHALSRNLLKETGKTYTGDLAQITNFTAPFTEKKYKEYEICGTKYVLFDDFKNYNVDRKLSDGRTIEELKQYWLEVEPIKWLVDEEKDIAITKNIIAAGIPFSNKIEYEGEFDKTDIKEYIDKYLIKEIVSRKNKREQTVKDIKKENLYEFNYW